MIKIQFFDKANIDELTWPETHEGQFSKKILLPMIKNGIEPYFENVKGILSLILIDGVVLPITINDCEKDNSYVCSFYSYYIGYGLSSAERIKNRFLRNIVKATIKSLGTFLKIGKIDKMVSINNWPFSTNIYPALTPPQVAAIRLFMEKKFPHHAIVFRCINAIDQNSPINILKKDQFNLIAARQIFVTDPKKKEVFETRLFKSDLKFLASANYTLGEIDLDNAELSKMLSLYNALYVDKYSDVNPRLTENFLQLLVENKLFNFKALKKDGKVDAIAGHYSMHGVMTSPFFGYDTSLPQETGLYRMLSTALALDAKNSGHLFHQSSGASFYKSIRKATPSMEYSAVYVKHLPLNRRFYWKTLKFMINSFGISWMKKY
ncbi:MAG TPA: hypothetical protein PLC42_06380 [Parachlamydiaceae bacterium]|nr:hypothetical protein [Parachlamydiaceae bacterium]